MNGFIPYNGGLTAGVRHALSSAGGLKALASQQGTEHARLVNELKRLVGRDDAYVTEEVKIAIDEAAEHGDALYNTDVNLIVTAIRKRVAVTDFEKSLDAQLETKVRHIRTPEGARKYGQPIGAIITRDMIERIGDPDIVDAPSGGTASRKRPAGQLKPGDKINFSKPGDDGKPQKISGTVDKVTTDGNITTVTVDGEDHKLRSKDPVNSERALDASGVEAPEPDSTSRVLSDLRAGLIDEEAARRRLEAVKAGTPEMIGPDGQTVTSDAPDADAPDAPDAPDAGPKAAASDTPPADDTAPNVVTEPGSHDDEIQKAQNNDEYATTVELDGEDEYATELPAVSDLTMQLNDMYSSAADLPKDDEFSSGILYVMEDLDIPADGDDDAAMSILMGRIEKAAKAAFGDEAFAGGSTVTGLSNDRIDAKGDGKIPMPAGKYPEGDPRNDPEYEQYIEATDEKIKTALSSGLDTESQFSVTMPDGTQTWTPTRARLHDDIIDGIMQKSADVPRERKAIMMGGLPGAGKSTFLREHGHKLGLDVNAKGEPTNAIVINPDEMKNVLMDMPGVVPRVDGLTDGEHAALVHEESSHLAKMLAARALADGYNVVFDITLGDGKKAKSKYLTNASGTGAKDLGYTVSAAFVDGDMATSLHRAGLRHKRPNEMTGERSYGGRYVSYGHILSEAAKPGQVDSDGNPAKSKNRVEYDELVGDGDTFENAIRMDNQTGEFYVDKDGGDLPPDLTGADDLTVPDDLRAAANNDAVPVFDNASELNALQDELTNGDTETEAETADDIVRKVATGQIGELDDTDHARLRAALASSDSQALQKLLKQILDAYGDDFGRGVNEYWEEAF